MSDIRTKLLGLAALATAFAGLSYGQTITCPAATATTNPTLRAEGETELVADLVVANCTNSVVAAGGLTGGTVVVSANTTVTGRSESTAFSGTFAGNSDVVLQVMTVAPAAAATTYYAGTVAGPNVVFANVTYPPTGFTLQVSNVRVNASAATNPQVTEGLLVSYPVVGTLTPSNISVAPISVGYVLPSLAISLVQNASNQNQFFAGTTSSFTTCSGVGTSSTALNFTAFALNLKELTANAFKLQGGENGSLLLASTANIAATTGLATQPTELMLTLTNVPQAATIYLPVTITSGGTTLSLQGSVAALTSPSNLVGIGTAAGTGGPGVFGFTPTAGTVTAVYVTTANTATGTTFYLPVFLTVAGGAAPVQTTAMAVSLAYAPAAAVTGPTSLIPTFAVSTVAPINTITVTACSTTLLFPYVTNVAGFESGLAIANTTTDNLGKAGASSATATTGVCTFNFYGNTATQPAAFLTPVPLGVYNATTGAAPVYANTLTSMLLGATNFSGYAIASCNFIDAHGFAFIIDGTLGQPTGVAEGYLALQTANSRTGTEAGLNN
jgi:hypothetical protein